MELSNVLNPECLTSYFTELRVFPSKQLWEHKFPLTKSHLRRADVQASRPLQRWRCCSAGLRGSIEQKSQSEEYSRGAIMKDRLSVKPCLALTLWSHWHIPQVLITESTPQRSCGRNNMGFTWHLDTCCKIYRDNWDTADREVHQVCLSW